MELATDIMAIIGWVLLANSAFSFFCQKPSRNTKRPIFPQSENIRLFNYSNRPNRRFFCAGVSDEILQYSSKYYFWFYLCLWVAFLAFCFNWIN